MLNVIVFFISAYKYIVQVRTLMIICSLYNGGFESHFHLKQLNETFYQKLWSFDDWSLFNHSLGYFDCLWHRFLNIGYYEIVTIDYIRLYYLFNLCYHNPPNEESLNSPYPYIFNCFKCICKTLFTLHKLHFFFQCDSVLWRLPIYLQNYLKYSNNCYIVINNLKNKAMNISL